MSLHEYMRVWEVMRGHMNSNSSVHSNLLKALSLGLNIRGRTGRRSVFLLRRIRRRRLLRVPVVPLRRSGTIIRWLLIKAWLDLTLLHWWRIHWHLTLHCAPPCEIAAQADDNGDFDDDCEHHADNDGCDHAS